MKQVEVGKKRNIVVLGHHGSGKTSLLEAMLYFTGAIDRLGRTTEGNTFADYLDEEKEKKITLTSKVIHCSYKGVEFNFIDTPGYADFVGDIKGAIHAADGALIVLNATSGVEVETERIWEYLDGYHMPRVVVVNQIDKDRANFNTCLESLESTLGAKVCPVRLPFGQESNFKGVIDLVTDKVLLFNEKGAITKQEDIPEDIHDEVEENRQKMIESSVVSDEALMERYLNDEPLEYDDIRHGLHDGVVTGAIIPIFVTDAYHCVGIQTLMDGLVNYMPEPNAKATFSAIHRDEPNETIEEPVKEDGPGIGIVFKSMIDPFIGKISFIRVYSGSFSGDSEWYNRTKQNKYRIAHILSMNGKKTTEIHKAICGDIIAVTKIDDFETNDTVSTEPGEILVKPTHYPPPPIHMALHAANKSDEDKVASALSKILNGDPTVHVERSYETHETVLHGAGSLQLELIAQRLRRQFNLNVELTSPKVAYRETIVAQGEGRYRHKKQSGGRGQFAEVQMRLRPLERGKQFEFINSIFGGAIPGKFVPAVEKGVVDAMERGIIAGYPVVDISVELFDGQYHDVDSSEMAFKIASSMCFRQVAKDSCRPILLEPIMNVRITIQDSYMGDVMGDLNSRRGRVMGMDPAGAGKQMIRAQVPLASMYSYSVDLRSITQGRGSFEMDFSHYEPVPNDLQEKIVAESKVEDLVEA